MLRLPPWVPRAMLVLAAVGLLWRGAAWLERMELTGAPAQATPSAGVPPADPAVERAIVAMRQGLTELRQAATTGEPAMLQEAEKDILAGLLDALDASVVDGTVDPGRYARVLEAVAEVEGLFKYIPYVLEVEPGGNLPGFTLLLRRSPYPMIEGREMAWRAALVGGGVKLTPRRR
ncbi:MAG: hypothetical protein ACLGIN_04790 [Candidatus Sericytochromatia bacterium]